MFVDHSIISMYGVVMLLQPKQIATYKHDTIVYSVLIFCLQTSQDQKEEKLILTYDYEWTEGQILNIDVCKTQMPPSPTYER